ncbi:MAG TPA: arylesterase [Pseudomonadota bacterium]|nr:arylesterase [Pseudomonadota bacterium]
MASSRTAFIHSLRPRNTGTGIMRSLSQIAIQAFVMVALLCASVAQAAAPKRVLVFGDSLSAAYNLAPERGWVNLLDQTLQAQGWRVANASISGETTAGGAARIEAVLAEQAPDVVIVELGANDGLRGLPLDLAKQNLARIIAAAKARKARVLLVGMELPPNYGPDYTTQFRQMYQDLAREHATALLPFLLAPISGDRGNFLEDNLHPTAQAQPALRDHVLKMLKPLLNEP